MQVFILKSSYNIIHRNTLDFLTEIEIITLVGPTASGKTPVAAHLTEMLGGVLFGADSRQVYRGMDIGTGKDLEDFNINGKVIPYRLIDICAAGERYNLHRYLEDFHEAYTALPKSTPKILCGGTGLYVEAVLKGYRMPDVPENLILREELNHLTLSQLQERCRSYGTESEPADPENSRRLIRAIEVAEFFKKHGPKYEDRAPLKGPIFCIDVDREVRRERISSRLKKRLDEGMIEEVERLLTTLTPEQLIYYGLEYRYVTEYVIGKITREEMERDLEIAIHQFAKRQMTWWRGMERRGFELRYIQPLATPRETAERILEMMKCE